ncbi:MAG: hypothetical protein KF822_12480 [Steroidobacteraceae bacterium]|nr:hypothetical protein [Steroidobacteraceae bacterium]
MTTLLRGALLSPHFTVDEALKSTPNLSGIPANVRPAVQLAAQRMEELRALLGRKPVNPTSWYRDFENNQRVGGKADSSHLSGYALDFTVKGMRPREIMHMIAANVTTLGVDQAIEYGGHVHISFDPRRRGQLLLATGGGTFVPWKPTEAIQPMSKEPGSPEPGSSAWWLALAAAIVTAILTFLTKQS